MGQLPSDKAPAENPPDKISKVLLKKAVKAGKKTVFILKSADKGISHLFSAVQKILIFKNKLSLDIRFFSGRVRNIPLRI